MSVSERSGLSNNGIAALALTFIVVSLVSNIMIYYSTEEHMPAAYSVSQGRVAVTIAGNYPSIDTVKLNDASDIDRICRLTGFVTISFNDAVY